MIDINKLMDMLVGFFTCYVTFGLLYIFLYINETISNIHKFKLNTIVDGIHIFNCTMLWPILFLAMCLDMIK